MQPMGGGLDQQINQKVDAYRNNPQALQQRYQQNQQLIDLLALQKLKSEKDAAARDMQMKMQTQPQTIKDQREAELLQRTKDDMVKQTAGVMQQKQAQQQKNMQRAAQGQMPQQRPQQPKMPMGQQAGGLGGLPMPKMAAGGIVAFQAGGLSEQISPSDLVGITPEELRQLRETNPERYRAIRNALAKQQRESASDYDMYGGAAGRTDTDQVGRDSQQRPSLLRRGLDSLRIGDSQSIVPGSRDMPPEQGPTALGPETFAPPVQRGGPEDFAFGVGADAQPRYTVKGMGEPQGPLPLGPETFAPPPPAQAQPKSDTSGIAALKESVMADMPTGVDASGANAAFRQGLAEADAYTKRDERYADLAKRRDEYEQFMEEEYDPSNRRLEGLSEALMAGYGAGGAGAVFSRAGKRMNAFNEGLRMQRAKGMLESVNMTMDMNKTDAELARMGMTTANAFRQDYMANQRAAMNAATQLGVQKLRMLDNEADRILQREKESNSQLYRMATLALEEQKRIDSALKDERLDDRQRIQLGQRGLELFQSVQEGMAAIAADQTGLTALETQLETAEALQDDDAIAELGPKIEAARAETVALTTSLVNDFGRVRDEDGNLKGTGLYDLIPKMIEMMGGNMSGIDVSDVTSVTTK